MLNYSSWARASSYLFISTTTKSWTFFPLNNKYLSRDWSPVTGHTTVLLLNTYCLMIIGRAYDIFIAIVEDYHSDAFISNLVTSTLVTIFCRLQKDFKIKSRLKSHNFLSYYYVLQDFDKFDSIRLFWESSNSVEGGFDWRKLCYSNKHFVAGWNEFCRPNSTRR